MYYGEAHTVLDEKGRITVPRKVRETMDHLGHLQWFMTRGFDGAIFVYPRPEWDKIRREASKWASMDGSAIDFRRLFFGGVAEVRPDRQGRIPIPQHLRDHAGIDKDVVLIGVDDHLELWSQEGWRGFREGKETSFKEMATELFARAREARSEEADGSDGLS